MLSARIRASRDSVEHMNPLTTEDPSSMIRTRGRTLRSLAPVAALALVVSACGDDDNASAASEPTAASTASDTTMHGDTASAGDATATAGAELRAGLTNLLEEHVYLAGITTGTALAGRDLTPAAETLDTNSVALSEAIGSVYGDAAGEQFLSLWRDHIEMFVDYTNGCRGR
jgi:hypothetical protein